MKKITKQTALTCLWVFLGLMWSPIFIVSLLIRVIARILLGLSYIGLLEGKMAKDVFKSIIIWYGHKHII